MSVNLTVGCCSHEMKTCPKCGKQQAGDSFLCSCGHEFGSDEVGNRSQQLPNVGCWVLFILIGILLLILAIIYSECKRGLRGLNGV